MKAVNVDDVLKILHKYGKYVFVTDEKKYSSMVDEIANLKALKQEPILDKIKEEISQLPITDTAIKLVTAVLDKYKTEVEVKE